MANRAAKKQQPKKEEAHPRGSTTPLEWAIAALGAMLLAALLLYLAYFAVSYRETAPAVSVEALSVAPAGAGYLVRYRVVNEANGTAAGLQVMGQLRRGDETIEEREAVIDYLPPFSAREGGFYFSQDPGSYELVLSLGGYSKP
jgi:uncharacterized protein (TIGR02588 family)